MNRLSQSQSTWLHCGQEICIESQEILVNIHVFVLVANQMSEIKWNKLFLLPENSLDMNLFAKLSFSLNSRTWFFCNIKLNLCYDRYIFVLSWWLDILTIFTHEYRVLTGNLDFYIGGDRKWKKLWQPGGVWGNAYFAYSGVAGPEFGKTCLHNTCTLPNI